MWITAAPQPRSWKNRVAADGGPTTIHGVYSDILLVPVHISEVLADGGNGR